MRDDPICVTCGHYKSRHLALIDGESECRDCLNGAPSLAASSPVSDRAAPHPHHEE